MLNNTDLGATRIQEPDLELATRTHLSKGPLANTSQQNKMEETDFAIEIDRLKGRLVKKTEKNSDELWDGSRLHPLLIVKVVQRREYGKKGRI